jgi:hypothetical protein
MANAEYKKMLERLEILAGQMALAESFNQPRKEKQYERELLKLESEILEIMEK